MKAFFNKIFMVIVLLLPGGSPLHADVYVRDDIITKPRPEKFSVCYDHTCETVVNIGLTPGQWSRIRHIFDPLPTTAAQERERIKSAIALMERMVGSKTGTDRDKGKNLKGLFHQGQMDCIDESTNTTNYLLMMKRDGLIRWHTIEDRATRYPSLLSWPHTTAVIREKRSQRYYAVDSWFFDNGQAPVIVPLKKWRTGWEPRQHSTK
jgi:hypothetical protein